MTPELQELLQSLTHTTARLASAQGEEPNQIKRALAERGRAIQAIQRQMQQHPPASQSGAAQLAAQLQRELDQGTQILLRLAVGREVMRNQRMTLDRQLQVLHGLRASRGTAAVVLSCRG